MKPENTILSEEQLDYIKETFNIGVGKGAKILNTMLNSHISLSVPELLILTEKESPEKYFDDYGELLASVDLNFNGSLTGLCKLIFPTTSALKLVSGIQGELENNVEDGFDAMSESILKEIGNIVLNSVVGVLCNYLKIQLNYSVPTFFESPLDELLETSIFKVDTVAMLAKIQFHIESLNIKGDIMTIFNMGSFAELLKLIEDQMND